MDISIHPQDPASEDVAVEQDNTTVPVASEFTGTGPTEIGEDGAPLPEAPEKPTQDDDQGEGE